MLFKKRLQPPSATEVHVRWLIRRDMPEIFGIEQACFEFPWREDDFIRCLRQRNCIAMAAEVGDEGPLAGFVIYELQSPRLHLLNFAVHPEHRRQGVGTALVNELKAKLSPRRRSQIWLEIRESNLAGQLFFRAAGFRATAVLRGFYDDTDEAAYQMRYRWRGEHA